jgi:hypothetical protein
MRLAFAAVIVFVIGACGDGDGQLSADAAAPDAATDGPLQYSMQVFARPWVPAEPEPLVVLIDGELADPDGNTRAQVERTYSSSAEARTKTMAIEVYLGDTLIAARTDRPGECSVLFDDFGAILNEFVSWCLLDNGEVRFGSIECESATGTGAGDGFCAARCSPSATMDTCADDRCGLVVKLADPYYAHVDCVPVGDRAVGESCSIDADGYDDCVEGAGCHEGTCRAWCWTANECGQQTCTPIPLITDGFGVCT